MLRFFRFRHGGELTATPSSTILSRQRGGRRAGNGRGSGSCRRVLSVLALERLAQPGRRSPACWSSCGCRCRPFEALKDSDPATWGRPALPAVPAPVRRHGQQGRGRPALRPADPGTGGCCCGWTPATPACRCSAARLTWAAGASSCGPRWATPLPSSTPRRCAEHRNPPKSNPETAMWIMNFKPNNGTSQRRAVTFSYCIDSVFSYGVGPGPGRLAHQTDLAGGDLPTRRRGRRHGAPDRPQTGRGAGPERDRREQTRCRRADRRGRRGQGRARRLHADAGRLVLRGEPVALSQAAV
jgi:hypothetical protein